MKKTNFSIKTTNTTSKEPRPPSIELSEITFEGHKFTVDLQKELKIDEESLVDCMVKHAGNYGWWVGVYTTVKRSLRRLKQDRERNSAALDSVARDDLISDGLKVTEAAVRARISTDPRVKKFAEEIEALEDLLEYAEAVMRALEHKRDMLKEINRNVCREAYNITTK